MKYASHGIQGDVCKVDHWLDFCREFLDVYASRAPWTWKLNSYEFISKAEEWAEGRPVCVVQCDDDHAMGSILLLFPTFREIDPKWIQCENGTAGQRPRRSVFNGCMVLHIPQSGLPHLMSFYPGHFDDLKKAVDLFANLPTE